jgi:hypothetical protein
MRHESRLFRGLYYGCLFSLPLYALIGACVWMVFR